MEDGDPGGRRRFPLLDVAALAMARNFDAAQPTGTDYDAVRDAYLEHRMRLCTEAQARAPT